MNALTAKQWKRFRRNRRGFYSFVVISVLFIVSLFSEALCNNKPFIAHFEGKTYFPLFKFYPGTEFGEESFTEVDYRSLRSNERFQKPGNWMIFPPVQYHPDEAMNNLPTPPPSPPTHQNWLGTDDRGRDLGVRLIYGFRNSMLFALASWVVVLVLSYITGAVQGYYGGRVDFYGQRAIEIWNALPVLYVIIFLLSIFPPSLFLLTVVWVAFSWMGLSSYVRVEVLRVRKQDFVTAARSIGASAPRIIFKHILPNTLTPIITFSPFIISASIGGLAALDYLGLGLPPPTSSWGELLKQGKENLQSWWLVIFPFASLFLTLLALNFVGEAVRSAFDSKEV